MRIGPRPDAMKPDIHGVGTPWIRSFMAFQVGPWAATLVARARWSSSATRWSSSATRW